MEIQIDYIDYIIASVIDTKDPKIAYDNYCKKILSNKQILAHILKECVSEFKDIPLEEIQTKNKCCFEWHDRWQEYRR